MPVIAFSAFPFARLCPLSSYVWSVEADKPGLKSFGAGTVLAPAPPPLNTCWASLRVIDSRVLPNVGRTHLLCPTVGILDTILRLSVTGWMLPHFIKICSPSLSSTLRYTV